MNIKNVVFAIEGTSPLLTHNPSSMRSGESGPSRKKIPTAVDEAAAGLYVGDDGRFYIPTIAFRNAILYGLRGKKIGKVGAATKLAPAVFIDPEHEMTMILDKNGKPAVKYEIDSRRAVVQRQGITRHRPKFYPWKAMVTLSVDLDIVSSEIVAREMDEAGTTAGVGDYRPQRTGWFGKFRASEA